MKFKTLAGIITLALAGGAQADHAAKITSEASLGACVGAVYTARELDVAVSRSTTNWYMGNHNGVARMTVLAEQVLVGTRNDNRPHAAEIYVARKFDQQDQEYFNGFWDGREAVLTGKHKSAIVAERCIGVN